MAEIQEIDYLNEEDIDEVEETLLEEVIDDFLLDLQDIE